MVTKNIYTPEMVADLAATYKADEENAVKILSERYGFSTRSIIAKLSAMKVYKRKVYKTKMGTEPVSKEQLIERLSETLGIDVCLLESLEKVAKQTLILMDARIKELRDV